MTEWKLFEGDTAYVSTAEYHKDRERAMHLEDPNHKDRLQKAYEFIIRAVSQFPATRLNPASVVDLGCGDGGLLQLLRLGMHANIIARGYDFAPANVDGSASRGLSNVQYLDLFPAVGNPVNSKVMEMRLDVVNMTEVIEHMSRPHQVLAFLAPRTKWLVASSPWNETDTNHADCHAWAWDARGYYRLLDEAGFHPELVARCGLHQVVLAKGRA